MQNIRLGFIGFGNMAQAMVKGLLLKEVLPADQIYACAKNWEKLERTTGSFGIHPCHDAREVAAGGSGDRGCEAVSGEGSAGAGS